MRRSRRLLASCTVLIAVAGSASTAEAARRHHHAPPTATEKRVLSLLNRVRADNGLPALRFRRGLYRAARAHTHDMLRRNYFSHGAFTERLANYVHTASVIGENLAWGTGAFATPESAVERWLDSPSHRAIILDRDFRFVGIGSRVGDFLGEARARVYTADFGG